MPWTVREFTDILNQRLAERGIEGISRDAIYKLVPNIPGAHKARVQAGRLEQWQVPEDAIEFLETHPETLEQAVTAVRTSASSFASTRPAGRGDPPRGTEEEELRREKIRLERDRVACDRAELEIRKSELERRRGGANAGGVDVSMLLLLDRLNGVERKLESGTGGGQAALLTAIAPLLAPLVQQLASRPGLSELLAATKAQDPLAVARELKELGVGGAGQDVMSSVGQLLKIATLLKPLLGRGQDAGGGFWALLAPEVPGMIGRVVDGVRDVAKLRVEQVRAGTREAGAPPLSPALAALYAELEGAAARFDQRYFPVFVNRVRELFPKGGTEMLEAIANGSMTADQALTQLQAAGFQPTPRIQAYLKVFVDWSRYARQRDAAPAPSSTTAPTVNGGAPPTPERVGRCTQCATEYTGDLESFDAPCDRCGGRVVDAAPAA